MKFNNVDQQLINFFDFLGLSGRVTYLGLRVFVCATYLGLRVCFVHSRFSCVHVPSFRNKVGQQLIKMVAFRGPLVHSTYWCACDCVPLHIWASVCVRSIWLNFESLGSGSVFPELVIPYLNPNERCSPERSRESLPFVASFPIIRLAVSSFQDEIAFAI